MVLLTGAAKILRRHRSGHAAEHPASHPPRMRGPQREALRRLILQLQDDISSPERCRKPVIAAIHGARIGGD